MVIACNGIYKLHLLVKDKKLMQKAPNSDNIPTLIAIGGQLHQLMDAKVNVWLC